jgi:Mg-chelatase subunit ChlD
LKNNAGGNIHLLRADAEPGLKVYTTKKTLRPGDTALLVISFLPEKKGTFNKKIRLVTSDASDPYELSLSGNLANLRTDDKMACYYFGSRRTPSAKTIDQPVLIQPDVTETEQEKKITGSGKPPAGDTSTTRPTQDNRTGKPVARSGQTGTVTVTEEKSALPLHTYRPNNILFLVDVSGSMKDSLKLPLMKKALHILIDAVRDIDSITLVTYADSIKIISEALSGNNKQHLHQLVEGLSARGMTRGRKAIHFSQELAQRHFIKGGNNQIIMASDGKFKFEKEDEMKWKTQQGDRNIVLSTVAFGDDREAIRNLKDISSRGNGSFIHIRNSETGKEALLDEIKKRSRIRNAR